MAGGELRFGTSSIYMAHSIAILCQKQGKSAHLHVYILKPRTRTSRVKSRPSCFGKREVQSRRRSAPHIDRLMLDADHDSPLRQAGQALCDPGGRTLSWE